MFIRKQDFFSYRQVFIATDGDENVLERIQNLRPDWKIFWDRDALESAGPTMNMTDFHGYEV